MVMISKKRMQCLALFLALSPVMQVLTRTELQTEVLVPMRDLLKKTLDLGKEEPVTVNKDTKLTLQIQMPTHDQMIATVMDLTVSEKPAVATDKTVALDPTSMKKLELVSGEEIAQQSLAGFLNKNIVTVFGEIMSMIRLVTPTSDFCELKETQEVLKKLLREPELFGAIQNELEIIHKVQPYFISYFKDENPVNNELFKKVYWGSWLNSLNSNPLTLELGVRLNNLMQFFAISSLPLLLGEGLGLVRFLKEALNGKPISFMKAWGQGITGLVDPRLEAYKDGGFDGRKKDVINSFVEIRELSKDYERINDALLHENPFEREALLMERQAIEKNLNEVAGKKFFSCN